MTGRPEAGEVAPFYVGYLDAAEGDDLAAALATAPLAATVRSLDPALGGHRYAPGKWTVAQVVQHVIDTERLFAGRVLRIARGDETPIPGFDQDPYVEAAPVRLLPDLADELDRLRASTRDLVGSLPEAALTRRGTASGKVLSARGAAWIIAGHERHHLRVLQERYL